MVLAGPPFVRKTGKIVAKTGESNSVGIPSHSCTIVIVNWNCGEDTICCLESLVASKSQDFRVVVVDNNSGDDSVPQIQNWASTNQLSFQTLSIEEVSSPCLMARYSLVCSDRNGGFAYGCNAGIRVGLGWSDCEFFWLLNPDTTADPNCLGSLFERMRRDDHPGMCGTNILFLDEPDRIQAVNGSRLNRFTGGSTGLLAGRRAQECLPEIRPDEIESQTDFVTGASLMLSRPFVADVGLMDENYFLFYEEIDLAVRNSGKHQVGYAIDAIVFHKHGASIGSTSKRGARSMTAERYLLESKLKFYRKHLPLYLPSVVVFTVAQLGVRLLRRDFAKFKLMLKVLINGLRISPKYQ